MPFRRIKGHTRKGERSARNQEIYRLRKQGMTLEAIGDKYGLSRERVRVICDRYEEVQRP